MFVYYKQRTLLYKGVFTLLLAVIMVELLLGALIVTGYWNYVFSFKLKRVKFPSVKQSLQKPIVMKRVGFLIGINTVVNVVAKNTTSSPASPLVTASTKYNGNNSAGFLDYSASSFSTFFYNFSSPLLGGRSNLTDLEIGEMCPDIYPDLHGRVPIIKVPVPSILDLEKIYSWLKPGGRWFPNTCRALKKVAVIIPFRCRIEHLLIFLRHMHPLLKRQQLNYTIFVIEQKGIETFNRGMLKNIGFVEALKIRDYDCFIFHDVDLLPEDDRILYTCPEQPRHMSVAVNIFKYKLPYPQLIGGVCAVTTEHFKLINGFSNSFWGWGGEDDDMFQRIMYHKLKISRYPRAIARYTMLPHKKDKFNPHRFELLRSGHKTFDKNGLNNLNYSIKELEERALYTWMLVELKPPN